MYIDTGTFWIITIILAVAIAVVYYTLKEKIEKKADFDSEIYFMAAFLFRTCQVLIDHSDKKTQDEANTIFALNEHRLNQVMDYLDKQLKKQQDNNNNNQK